MGAALTGETLDHLLALQLTVAWAGEGLSQPVRLGWWKTDLVDEMGGGDLFARLLPRTRHWASLEAVRTAAVRVDAEARGRVADPDGVRTIFFWGLRVDEKLGDRLAFHKRGGKPPAEVLPLKLGLGADFDRVALEEVLGRAEVEHEVVPGGRELRGAQPEELTALADRLGAALVPLAERYPMPFVRIPK
jgi:hypothetical protein